MEPVLVYIETEIKLYGIKALNFPHGIPEAFEKLESMYNFNEREVYGLSGCFDNAVQYWACIKPVQGDDPAEGGLTTVSIPAGNYLSVTLENWQQRLQEMPDLFNELLKHPDVAPKALCVEYYRTGSEADLMVSSK